MSKIKNISLCFDAGTLIVDHVTPTHEERLGKLIRFDERIGTWRARACDYKRIMLLLHKNFEYQDDARDYANLDVQLPDNFQPRPHQSQALQAWKSASCRGLVVLPTGTGKSYLAQMAIQFCKRPTLIMVPTIDLMHQWHRGLEENFSCSVGLLGGGNRDIQPLTVSTYDSALLMMEFIGNQFGLLIFDECHHLPGDRMKQTALMSLAPFRMGLSATPERDTPDLSLYNELTGPLCFRMEIDELKGGILSPYRTELLELDLEEDEEFAYHENRQIYLDFLKMSGISFQNGDGWARFIMACARSTEGKAAFKAFHEQKRIARCGRSKFRAIWDITRQHAGERIIIFTADNATAYEIGRRFFMPVLTHHTKPGERKLMLERFRSGQHPCLVTSKVLNEGVDVPEASVGVIVSGSGSTREHVQRLGRILRKSKDKQAVLYELISRNTSEFNISERRRQHSAYGKSDIPS